jgi:hypothetical protein
MSVIENIYQALHNAQRYMIFWNIQKNIRQGHISSSIFAVNSIINL